MKTTPHMVIWTSAALFLGACGAATTADLSVQAEADASKPVIEATRVELGPAVSTIKPGASVSFSHETSGPVPVDGTGYATITVNEGYPYGTLELVASANSGLEVRGTSASQIVNMADGTAHSWRVDYQGLTDGVHYLTVMAVAKPTADAGEMRAYAVRVEVGDWKAVKAERDAAKPMEALADGEMAIMMQAEETIE